MMFTRTSNSMVGVGRYDRKEDTRENGTGSPHDYGQDVTIAQNFPLNQTCLRD